MADVRVGSHRDVQPAIEVWRAANDGSPIPGHAHTLEGWARSPDGALIVAADGDRLIGMALLLVGRADDGAGNAVPGLAHLTGVAVLPERRRTGVGAELVRFALEHARHRGDNRMTLWTAADNDSAQRLFNGCGFRPTGRTDSDASGRLTILMEAYL